jgi:ubiquinone/menaquinone biosynthesis C-methylase UbiE
MMRKLYYRLHRVSKFREKDEPSGGWWHRRVRQEAVNLCQKYKGRVLEVGCGEGLFLANLAILNPRIEIVGIDNNINKLSKAKERCAINKLNNIELIDANALGIPFSDEYFDGTVCINTFFNMQSIEIVNQALAEIARVCKKGGKIIFDFRNSLNPFLRLKYKFSPYYDATVKEDKLPLNTYNPKDMEKVLSKLNLTIMNKIYIGFPGNILSPIIMIEAEKC